MKKHPIGFNMRAKEEPDKEVQTIQKTETKVPRKSVVQVYFSHRGTGWAYYNDSFDLKVGDYVYVEGKLEGYRGRVTEVNYSFKIKLSDYKKVIAVVDTDVKGDLYLAGSHIVSFDKNTIPFSKVLTWFKAPEADDEYISSNDDSESFPLDDLSKMKASHEIADRGYDVFLENNVSFIEIDRSRGRAIVEGSESYEIEFDYLNGEISNLKCSCFCSGKCKHEFATMLQLKETLDIIAEHYENEYDDYFAVVSKGVFMNIVMNKKVSGKISLEGE